MLRYVLLLLVMAVSAPAAQDPPRPDAVPFCQHEQESQEASFCTCATANDGDLCKSEEPLPNFCKKMCGHAKDCHCCNLKK